MNGRQLISSGAPWEPIFGYSRAVRVGNQVFVAGTIGRNSDGSVPSGAYQQAKRALETIGKSADAGLIVPNTSPCAPRNVVEKRNVSDENARVRTTWSKPAPASASALWRSGDSSSPTTWWR